MQSISDTRRRALESTAFKEEDGHLTQVEVDEMFRLVSHVRAEVASDDAMPGGVVFFVEFLLDIRRDIFFDVVSKERRSSLRVQLFGCGPGLSVMGATRGDGTGGIRHRRRWWPPPTKTALGESDAHLARGRRIASLDEGGAPTVARTRPADRRRIRNDTNP